MDNILQLNRENDAEMHEKKVNGTLQKEREAWLSDNESGFYKLYMSEDIAGAFEEMCRKVRIPEIQDRTFFYVIDYYFALDRIRGYCFGNLTPDYNTFLRSGIEGLFITEEENRFCKDYNRIINGIHILAERIYEKTHGKIRESFKSVIDKPASSLFDAMQRVLFANQIMWQTDHYLTGLGALDSILYPYYEADVKSGVLSREEAKGMLTDFIKTLHGYYWYKSSMLMGDTGQVFVIGRTNAEGKYEYNDLTMMIIECIKELQIPDPKVLLRVNADTPDELLSLALDTISTGVGSPLLSNDKRIIPALTQFGIKVEDACNYTVSACWEPLGGGKSVSLNNMTTLNFMRPLENMFRREQLSRITDFEGLMDSYKIYLARNLNAVKRVVKNAHFQYDPILSVFVSDCRNRKRDVTQGGAEYFDAGITSVALGNVVDSLLNIKELVFERGMYDLFEVKKLILTDFNDNKELQQLLKAKKGRFGSDDPEALDISNDIIRFVTENTSGFRTEYGGRLKFGLSAPTYIDAAKEAFASMDGRSEGDPFSVHISNDSANGYMETIEFAARLNYEENRFNGNVIDLMVNPAYIRNNVHKFVQFIRTAIADGFFQMQMNVVSSQQLILAKKDPKAFPHLIVRVWGFSAYFNDLPDDYKDKLIERALRNERNNAA